MKWPLRREVAGEPDNPPCTADHPRTRGGCRYRKVHRDAGRLPGRTGPRGRLPGLSTQQRHLRSTPRRHQPNGADQGPLRGHLRRPVRHPGHHLHRTQPRLGPHHHPAEPAVPLRGVDRGTGGDAEAGRGRTHHPGGVWRHGPQRTGMPPRWGLPLRGARHQRLGRGHLPPLRPQPAKPAPPPEVQDQLLGMLHRLWPGHVQRRRGGGCHADHRGGPGGGRLPGLRGRRPRYHPVPGPGP